MKTVGVVLTVIYLSSFGCDGRNLRWVPNTDFGNPRNWITGRLPCSNERVRFPAQTASVFVQRNNTMLEIILPNDGEIVLGEGVMLTFPSSPADADGTCPEQETYYNGSEPAVWYDVRNWCEADDDDSCKGNPPRRLHAEGIPCVYDDVIFPHDSRFVVNIGAGADIRVATVRIGQQQLTTDELRERMNSDLSRRQFVRNSTDGATTNTDTNITVTADTRCDDVTGCDCDNRQLKAWVCAVEASRCNVVSCDDAVQPQQHCCAVCGAVFQLQYDPGFRLDAIEQMLSNNSPDSNESTDEFDDDDGRVWWIVSKVGSGSETLIQVVIADDGDGSRAKVVAYDIKLLLQNDMKETGSLHVRSLTMDVSGAARASAHSHTGEISSGSSPTVIVVVIVVIIIVIAISAAVGCYVLRRQGKRLPMPRMPTLPTIPMPQMPQFVRWRLRGRGGSGPGTLGDMELGRRGVLFDNRIIFDVSATSFDNLTFENQPRRELDQLEVQPRMPEEAAGFDNPMYGAGALQESFGVPTIESSVVPVGPRVPGAAPPSRFQSIPLVSRVAGMLRGLRFNVASQKLEDTSGDVTAGTGNDVNDNEKPEEEEEEEEEGCSGLPAPDIQGAEKKMLRSWKIKKIGRKERDGGEKHHHMKEEQASDSDDDLSGKTARKLATQTSDKGFGNPCYELGPIDLPASPAVAMTTATPSSESTATAAPTDIYRTGFANPMFEETARAAVASPDSDDD